MINPVNRQTDSQTDTDENITSLAEEINIVASVLLFDVVKSGQMTQLFIMTKNILMILLLLGLLMQLSKQMDSFRSNLEEFAGQHREEIRRNPQFRSQFQAMCAAIGVDPLACKLSQFIMINVCLLMYLVMYSACK